MARELLFKVTRDDFTETHIRGSGNGGQARNKVHSGVRLVHRESQAVGEATDSRHQSANRSLAFRRLRETPEFKAWFRTKVAKAMGQKSVEERVEEWTQDKYVTTQVKDEKGRWTTTEVPSLTT